MSAQGAATKNGITKGTLGVAFPALPLIAIGAGVGLGWLVAEGLVRLPFGLGVALGITLFHGSFGFAQAYRDLLSGRGGDAVLAHVVMLAAATILFAPALAQGSAFGNSVVGAMAPFGVSVAFGAFLFGIGMQLGGACASGCLYTVGGGNTRTLVTLIAFCIGAFIGSLHLEWWLELPSAGELSFSGLLGWELAVPVQLTLLIVIAIILRSRFHAGLGFDRPRGRAWLAGPWPLMFAALALAILNWLTLVASGHPWSITWAFTLWGAKIARVFGWDPSSSGFWSSPFQQAALNAGLWNDETSVMNFGLVMGAFIAASASRRFRINLSIPPLSLLAAILGGLMMGYGARLSFGCNIGAFFSGIASTSLHGWLWIVMALVGTWLGIRLRRLFQLEG